MTHTNSSSDLNNYKLYSSSQAMSANVQPLLQQVGSPSGHSDSSTRISTPAELKLERGVRSPLSLAAHHHHQQQSLTMRRIVLQRHWCSVPEPTAHPWDLPLLNLHQSHHLGRAIPSHPRTVICGMCLAGCHGLQFNMCHSCYSDRNSGQ